MRYQNPPRRFLPQSGVLVPHVEYPSKYREKVYEAICDYAATHGGNPPTVREIMELVGISSTSVAGHNIHQLIKQGRLEVIDRKLCVVGATWTPPGGAK